MTYQYVCRICGSHHTRIVYEKAHDYITGDIFQVWQCQDCLVAATDPQPTDLSPYYPSRYRHYTPVVISILKALYGQRVKRWANRFTEPGTAFEMGCGDGFMLDNLRKLGWKVVGNERTVAMAQFARQQLGLDVFVGDLDALRPVPTFGLVILFQVLEHLDDPVPVLRQISQILTPGGKLIIGVPNFDSWQASWGKDRWLHLDVPRHLFHYSPASLENTLKLAGLTTEDVQYVSLEHDPFGWLQTLYNRLDSRRNRLTRTLMALDRPTLAVIIELGLLPFLGVVCLMLSIASWLVAKGAIIQVIARKV